MHFRGKTQRARPAGGPKHGGSKQSGAQQSGLIYRDGFVSPREKQILFEELSQFHPIWEYRFSEHNPPPEGASQRRLLRPVYWLGNWQFACLNYYHPPKGIEFRCVEAEPFPPQMQAMVEEIMELVRNNSTLATFRAAGS
jgi:DNA oxidative demethylase